jgi:hypothetical protein
LEYSTLQRRMFQHFFLVLLKQINRVFQSRHEFSNLLIRRIIVRMSTFVWWKPDNCANKVPTCSNKSNQTWTTRNKQSGDVWSLKTQSQCVNCFDFVFVHIFCQTCTTKRNKHNWCVDVSMEIW